MNIRNRVQKLVYVKAGELVPNPKNWRTHPEPQKRALAGILEEVGYADALLARRLDDGRLMLIDGHLRAEISPDEEVPVLLLDLDEAEADKLLAILDPLAGMAHSNAEAFETLLRDTQTSNESVAALLSELAEKIGVIDADKTFVLPPNAGGTEYDESVEEDVEYCTCPNCGAEFAA